MNNKTQHNGIRNTEYERRLKGQALTELALVMSFLMFIIFLLWGFSMYLTEYSITKYAGFMAARSYQVFGNADAIERSNGKRYQEVAKDILARSMPYLDREDVDVYVDSYAFSSRPQFLKKEEEWKRYMKLYKMATTGIDYANKTNPRFGILKIGYKRGRVPFLYDENDERLLGSQKVLVPYRLEERLDAHK